MQCTSLSRPKIQNRFTQLSSVSALLLQCCLYGSRATWNGPWQELWLNLRSDLRGTCWHLELSPFEPYLLTNLILKNAWEGNCSFPMKRSVPVSQKTILPSSVPILEAGYPFRSSRDKKRRKRQQTERHKVFLSCRRSVFRRGYHVSFQRYDLSCCGFWIIFRG